MQQMYGALLKETTVFQCIAMYGIVKDLKGFIPDLMV